MDTKRFAVFCERLENMQKPPCHVSTIEHGRCVEEMVREVATQA